MSPWIARPRTFAGLGLYALRFSGNPEERIPDFRKTGAMRAIFLHPQTRAVNRINSAWRLSSQCKKKLKGAESVDGEFPNRRRFHATEIDMAMPKACRIPTRRQRRRGAGEMAGTGLPIGFQRDYRGLLAGLYCNVSVLTINTKQDKAVGAVCDRGGGDDGGRRYKLKERLNDRAGIHGGESWTYLSLSPPAALAFCRIIKNIKY
ncbi:hypothetical protein ACKI2N_033095 [Cupriavidus sp. 30B13]|uniref:hypothetical protein n=1 Tax=Cupriavidus sp. 30B13 TaxID=3384241 RepID=UPI003B8EC4E7